MIARFLRPFLDISKSPRGLWYVIGAFVVESAAYFGILTLMVSYFSEGLGWPDQYASVTVSVFTMLVTLFMLGVGSFAESYGLRRAILAALFVSTLGRVVYCLLPMVHGVVPVVLSTGLALLLVAIGSGILQPTCYSGVKQYTVEKTSSLGYAMIYALMNLGMFFMAALSAWIRPGVQKLLENTNAPEHVNPILALFGSFSASGIQAVNWVCCGLTGLTFLAFAFLMTPSTEAAKLRPDITPADDGRRGSIVSRSIEYFTQGPFRNARFLFFIFMLMPVRTLFAHQWLTMPEYILRSYSPEVGDRMEWLVNWINPLIIFFGVPIVAIVTRRFHVYTMMIVGSAVSAAPTFLLCFGPNLTLLITYFVLFSIGEALWSARFMEYASDLAPPGRVAQYMGLAQIPWLLAKGTTGLYSGLLMAKYCPPKTDAADLHTGSLWLIYGAIAMLSPIGLWLARDWVKKGLHTPIHEPVEMPPAME